MTNIVAKTMIDLKKKIYKCEGWTRAFNESEAKRIKSAYTITIDVKKNQWIGVKK
jgi:hypothetical protein